MERRGTPVRSLAGWPPPLGQVRGGPAVDSIYGCISAVTRAELRYGVARRPEAKRLIELVETFLAVAHCAPWDAAAADRHGLGAVLVTGNLRHYRRVPGLVVEDWIAR